MAEPIEPTLRVAKNSALWRDRKRRQVETKPPLFYGVGVASDVAVQVELRAVGPEVARDRGERTEALPVDDLDTAEPVYQSFEGWDALPSSARALDALPAAARRYLQAVEQLVGCRIGLVSIGADREQTIVLDDPWK